MTDMIPAKPLPETADGRSNKGQVTGKLKVAIDAMLYEGARRADAAAKAGMTDHSVRSAMRKPHVLAYYNAGLEVLRTSERPRNIRRLAEIRDKADNMPAVQAIRALEQMAEDEGRTPGAFRQQLPGLVVQINVGGMKQAPAPIDVTPRAAPADVEPGTAYKLPHPDPVFRPRRDE
jgi:hypothetical protein